MKKEVLILFGIILIMVISGCSKQEVSDIVPEEVPHVEENVSEAKPVVNETLETTGESEEEIPVEDIVETAPAAEETHEEKPALPAPLASFEDKFDGTSIDPDRYSTTITGAGTIAQNNEIVMAGKGDNTIIWNILYTKGDVDLTKGFTASVKINMKKAAITVGDDMVIIGIEKREKVQDGGKPDKAGYCEVFTEVRHGNEIRLRMENTFGQDNREGVIVPATSGVLALTYLPKDNLLKCSFGNKETTLSQPRDTGSFALTLRTGMHGDIIGGRGGYSESGGTGEFETVFDDFEFKSAVG